LASLNLDLLGSRFTITAPDPAWAALLRDLWGGFEADEGAEGRAIAVERTNDRFVLRLPGEPPLDFEDPWTLAEVLRYWMADKAVEDATGVLPIHAASLEDEAGGLLLVGGSGAGKTTLTLALAAAGWRLGSDDVAAIDLETRLVRPFPKPLGIRDPSLWPEEHRRGWTPPWPEQRSGPIVVPPGLFARLAVPFRPTRLAFIRWSEEASAGLIPISPARATARLVEYVRAVTPDTLAVLTRLCTSVACCDLTYRSSAEAISLLSEFAANNPKTG
jgi:hypothetical protein